MLPSVPDMETTYISAKEASDYTGLSQRRINQLVAAGTLPSIRIGNSNAIKKGAELNRLKRLKPAKGSSNGRAGR